MCGGAKGTDTTEAKENKSESARSADLKYDRKKGHVR